LDYADCEVLQKHYTDLLKAELPEEDYNQKVINFWKDFYNDVFSNIKRED
jgi:hypothetical protein